MTTYAQYSQNGDSIPYTPSTAVTAGAVIPVGQFVGIAKLDIAASALGALAVTGVYITLKDTSVFAAGDKVYWDNVNLAATRTASGNTFMGLAVYAQLTGDTTVTVLLDATGIGVGGLLYSEVAASAAVSNTTVETALDAGCTIAANTLNAGDVIHITGQVIATAINSTNTLVIKVYLGTAALLATAATNFTANDIIYYDITVVVRTNGVSGTFVATGAYNFGTPGTATNRALVVASTALNTTISNIVYASATWSVANSGNSCRQDIGNVTLSRH